MGLLRPLSARRRAAEGVLDRVGRRRPRRALSPRARGRAANRARGSAISRAFAAWALVAAAPIHAAAQTATAPVDRQGAFPDATFEIAYRKYTPPETPFSAFYSWDAQLGGDVTISRFGPNAIHFVGIEETAGTTLLPGHQIGVAGTAYQIKLRYDRAISSSLTISAALNHISTHLSQDLTVKAAEEAAQGVALPHVADRGEVNVLGFEVDKRWTSMRARPRVRLSVEPVGITFKGHLYWYNRPIFADGLATMWQGRESRLVVEGETELGARSFNRYTARLELYARGQAEGRLQIFGSYVPGNGFHFGPNLGALRGGISAGVLVRFRAR